MELIRINDRISYIDSIDEPLSANVIIIDAGSSSWIYDVGNSPSVSDYLNTLPGSKNLVFSHFHPDHIGGLSDVSYDSLYVSNNTHKYTNTGNIVSGTFCVNDLIDISIHTFPSSHAKGCLALLAMNYLFVGDALYGSYKNGKCCYNVSILTEQIRFLKNHPCNFVALSHRKPFLMDSSEVMKVLENILALKSSDSPYIYTDIHL